MARIVINSWGSYGDVNPYLSLAVALRARGHEAVLALPAHFADDVARAGFAFAPVGRVMDLETAVSEGVVGRIMSARRGAEFIYRELLMPVLTETYRELLAACEGADLLVSQPLGVAAPLVAEVTGVRWAATVLAPLSFGSGYEMVVPPPAPWLKQLEMLGPGVGHFFARFMRTVSAPWAAPVQSLRRDLGLAPGAHPIFEGQFGAPRVLAMFSRVLASPQPDWPTHTHITGQLTHDTTHADALSPALQHFLDAGEAPIVFTLGSSMVQHSGTFYDESIRAARALGQRAVFLAGASTTARLAHTLPASMCMIDAAPHSLLFPRARVIVQHCGVGTLGSSLRAGVPILSVPFAHDQPDNAWRAERLGVSRTLRPGAYRATRVSHELRQLIDVPSYAERALAISAIVQSEGGAATACDVLEAYISEPTTAARVLTTSSPRTP